jgi:hypothetical protein
LFDEDVKFHDVPMWIDVERHAAQHITSTAAILAATT